MNNHKVMFVVGFPKVNYIKQNKNEELVNVYMDTTEGKYLREMMKEALATAGLTAEDKVDAKVVFSYRQIPEILKDNKKVERIQYKTPTAIAANRYKEDLYNDIVAYDPDIIVPLDGLSTKPLLNSSAISKVQGQGVQTDIRGKNYWIMPSYGPSYAIVKPEVEVFIKRALGKVAAYLKGGEEVLKSAVAPTRVLDNNIEEVKKVFAEALKHGKTPDDPISWDLETNSLVPEAPGAKILTLSMAWHEEDGTSSPGITVPINHKEKPWNEDEQKLVDKFLSGVVNSHLWKVGHNIKFDTHQVKTLLDYDIRVHNNMDTMVAYYLAVSQEQKDSFGLKTMAHYYTPYANYEDPLEEYKAWFLKYLVELEKVDKGKMTIDQVKTLDILTDEEKVVAENNARELLAEFGSAKEVKAVDGGNFSYEWIPYSLLTKYASTDSLVTLMTHDELYQNKIKMNPDWVELYTNHYPRVLNALTVMEADGIQLDVERLEEIRDLNQATMDNLMSKIRSNEWVKQVEELHNQQYLEGLKEKAKPVKERDSSLYKYYTKYKDPESRVFSPTSGEDVKLALFHFGGLELPLEKAYFSDKSFSAIQAGKEPIYSDYSVGKESRKALMKKYPEAKVVKYLQEFAELAKINSTYTTSWIEQADGDNVIHGRFNMTGTATGRLSSSGPNLQNIPAMTTNPNLHNYWAPVKSSMVPYKKYGHDTFVMCDFSAQELRVAALLADDGDLMKAMMEGRDVHKYVASLAFGIPEDKVDHDQRKKAKSVSFG